MFQPNREVIVFPTNVLMPPLVMTQTQGYIGDPSPVIIGNDWWRNAILMVNARLIPTGDTLTINVFAFDPTTNQPMPSSSSGTSMGAALITSGALSATSGETLLYFFASGVVWNGTIPVHFVLPRKLFVSAHHSSQSATYDYSVSLSLTH